MQDLSNIIFGKLTVIKFDKKNAAYKNFWLCKCECGKFTSYRSDLLKSGRRKSCGCLKSPNEIEYRERLKKRLLKNSIRHENCLIWNGQKNLNGQGLIKTRNGMRNVGRVSWYAHNGNIPNGLFVLHSCDNPLCCEISHLRLGTHHDNMKDKVERNRQFFNKGQIHGMSKFSNETIIEIRCLYETGLYSQAFLSRKYNVSTSCIYNIVKRKTWKHI